MRSMILDMRAKRVNIGALTAITALAALCAVTCLRAEEPKVSTPPPVAAPDKGTPDKKSDDPKKDDVKTAPANDKVAKDDHDGDKPDGEAVPIDPTQWSPKMREAVNPRPKYVPPVNSGVAPAPVVLPTLPEIVLKGLIEIEGKPPSALLEIDGKLQRYVTEGAQLTSHPVGKPSLTILVKKISTVGVEIEIVQLKQTIHLQ